MDPELTTCPKCKRSGCWTLETTVDEDPYAWELLIYKDWVCKCGHSVPVEYEAMTDKQQEVKQPSWDIDDAKKLLEQFDEAMASQPKGISNATLIVMANYGDLAVEHLRSAIQAHAALSAEAQRLREALNALYMQALQSNVNEPSNEYGREALGMARAALNQERT